MADKVTLSFRTDSTLECFKEWLNMPEITITNFDYKLSIEINDVAKYNGDNN